MHPGRARGTVAAICGVLALMVVSTGLVRGEAPENAAPVFDVPRGADGWPLPLDGVRWSHADVVWALDGAPLMVRRIVYCEVGRSGHYDPWAVGGMGEIGPAQLLPGNGNGLSIFYRFGYTEPNSPWQARAWIEEVIGRGMLGSQYPRTSLGCLGSP